MSMHDCFGAPLSTDRRASAEAFDAAATLLLGFFADPLAVIEQALAEDPDFVMGHCFRAGLHLIPSEKACVEVLAEELQALRRLAPRANARERGHMAAIQAWHDGDFHKASELYGRVLFEEPRDAVALQLAHQCDFLLGQTTMLRDRPARLLPHWSETDAAFPYILGMRAFGLEECGHYEQAEETGRRAVALQPRDAWAVHAVAHVYEMQGRTSDGIGWLGSRADDWSPNNMFAYHNWWHLALYHLEHGDTAKVLALYDEKIRPEPSRLAMEMLDGASMLWRLHLRGVDVGARWEELASGYAEHVEDAYYPFNDMHAMMAFLATGRHREADRLLDALRARAGDDSSSARLIRDVGLPVAHGFHAFGRGDYAAAFDLLQGARKTANQFGGSHAQRDVLNLTLLEAAMRMGDTAAAEGLLNERLAAKPASPLASAMRTRIQAPHMQGNTDAA